MWTIANVQMMKTVSGKRNWHMFWHPWMYWLGHGGWFYFSLFHPVRTMSWWWRYAVSIPRSRGLRWS